MRSILVTGGAGYIGSHTVVELVQAGYRPVIVDNFVNSDKNVIKRIEKVVDTDVAHYEADYRNSRKIEEIILKEAIEGVVHFAAFKAVGESVANPLKYYRNNVSGFVDLIELCTITGVSAFVFSSSAAVYGNPSETPAVETAPCRPSSPYGWSKYMDEVILRDESIANSKLKATALRYFNVVGAHESALIGEMPKGKPQNLLPIIVNAASGAEDQLTIFGVKHPTKDGTCLRDYVHVVDLAKAHVAALNKSFSAKKGFNEVYNIGTGEPTSVFELIHAFEKTNKVKLPYSIGDSRPGDPIACYASVKKAHTKLGWKAEKTIEDAVSDAWKWHLASK